MSKEITPAAMICFVLALAVSTFIIHHAGKAEGIKEAIWGYYIVANCFCYFIGRRTGDFNNGDLEISDFIMLLLGPIAFHSWLFMKLWYTLKWRMT